MWGRCRLRYQWNWMTAHLEMGSADVAHTGRIWGHNFWQYFFLPSFSLFFFNFILPKNLLNLCYHTFFSLCITKNAQTHPEAPKPIPDDSSTVKAWHSRAPHFICIVTQQLPPPPAHVGIRCTETAGFSKQSSASISQIIFWNWEEIALDCYMAPQVMCNPKLSIGDGWVMNVSFQRNLPNLQHCPQ